MTDALRRELLGRREAAVRRLADLDGHLDAEGDVVDSMVAAAARDTSLAQREMVRERIRALDRALERLAAGTHGQCDRCQLAIPEARLAAVPEARFCVPCQSRAER